MPDRTDATTDRATPRERVAMRREAVLAVVTRRPGLTSREVEEDVEEGGTYWLRFGMLGPYQDLRWLERAGRVESIKVTARTVVWTPLQEAGDACGDA